MVIALVVAFIFPSTPDSSTAVMYLKLLCSPPPLNVFQLVPGEPQFNGAGDYQNPQKVYDFPWLQQGLGEVDYKA